MPYKPDDVMTVRDLIRELLDYPMDTVVYLPVGRAPSLCPLGAIGGNVAKGTVYLAAYTEELKDMGDWEETLNYRRKV